MIYLEKSDKDYLAAYFEDCKKKGHKLSEWGGESCCSVCGSAGYIIYLRDKLKKNPIKPRPD